MTFWQYIRFVGESIAIIIFYESDGLMVFLSELSFGYYGELKVASKRHLGTLAPFGPGASN